MKTVGLTHTIVYDARSPRPWCVIRLADKVLVDACFEEATAHVRHSKCAQFACRNPGVSQDVSQACQITQR